MGLLGLLQGHSHEPRYLSPVGQESLTAVLDQLVTKMASRGMYFEGYNPLSLAHYATLSSKQQQSIFAQLMIWNSSLEASGWVIGLKAADMTGLLHFTSRLNVEVDEGFFSAMRDGDVVEAYVIGSDGVPFQVYRNMAFLLMCSYDLLTLLSHPMNDLFHRDVDVQRIIGENIGNVLLAGRAKQCEIPEHDLTERRHPKLRKFRIRNRFAAPMLDFEGRSVGFVSTLQASPSGSVLDSTDRVAALR